MTAARRAQIAEATEQIRPLLGSQRLVDLYVRIGFVAICRPDRLAALEQLAEAILAKPSMSRVSVEVPSSPKRLPNSGRKTQRPA